MAACVVVGGMELQKLNFLYLLILGADKYLRDFAVCRFANRNNESYQLTAFIFKFILQVMKFRYQKVLKKYIYIIHYFNAIFA